MEEALGRSLAAGNTAEIFEWGSRVMKLYKKDYPAAKPKAFREAATSEIAMAYLDSYCSLANIDRSTILHWLPYVAAAKLAEAVPGERAGLLEIVGSSPTRGASSR